MVDKFVNYKALGKRLQERRQQLEFSQSVAAEKLDLSTSFYSRVERGEKKASLDTLVKIANFYELSLDYLLMESLNLSVSNELQTELKQIFVDKSQENTDRLLNLIKLLSNNIDEI